MDDNTKETILRLAFMLACLTALGMVGSCHIKERTIIMQEKQLAK